LDQDKLRLILEVLKTEDHNI